MPINSRQSHGSMGFGALIAVVMLSCLALVFSILTLTVSAEYSESVYLKEMRIQKELYAKACFDTANLMSAKDYFLKGTIEIEEFKCKATIFRDSLNNPIIDVLVDM
jgi:hypothetical protein